MEKLTKWAFRNKAAMAVMIVLVLALGGISYFTLPMEFLPEADNPQVTVATLANGYDAESMTQKVTNPIEDAVSTVKGKTNVMSSTGDGYSQVNVFFDSKTNMKEAGREVEKALGTLSFPDGVRKPNIVQLNTSMIPIAEVSLTFKDGLTRENMDKAKKDVLPMFQSLKGAGNVALYGKNPPKIAVHLNKKKMAKHHIPLQSVMEPLKGQNLSVSAGEKAVGGEMNNLKVVGDLTNLDALRDLMIQPPVSGAPKVKLTDIATIDQQTNQDTISRINGKEATAFEVFKDSNTSAVTLGKQVQKTVDQVNKKYDDVHADMVFATSDMVTHSVDSMMREVLLGALFATLVIVLFLRNLRSTLITVVSIPLSLGLTLFLLWKSGVTLNILTLGGVAVAVGRLVDDSIVVIENIFRRTQNGKFTKERVIEATREVGIAITASTLTTVAVFLPMGLIEGSLRSFLLPFALTITYSLLASLLVALTVVPLMSAWLLKFSKLAPHKQPKRYISVLRWALNHKFVPILGAFGILIGSIGLYTAIPKGAMSAKDASMVNINLTYPSDTPVSKIKEKAVAFEKDLLPLKGYKYVVTQHGNSGDAAKWGQVNDPTEVNYTVIMKDGANANTFIKKIKGLKGDYPKASITANAGSLMGSESTEITYDLIGENEDKIVNASHQIKDTIKDVGGVKKVSTNVEEKKPVYSIVVDSSKASTQQIGTQIQSLLNPTPIGTMKLNGQDTDILIDADIDPTSVKDLKQLKLATPKGLTPLSSVASIKKTDESSTVLHKDGNLFVRVSAEVDPNKLSVISKKLDSKVKNVKLPDGVELETGGASADQASDFSDIGLTMLASIGLVFLIMVITFRSIRTPIAILMTLPLAAIGAVLGLMIANVPVDPTALFGGLMLIGIVVTNAIVLLDRVKQNEKHMTIREAIVEGAATRVRPILMTAIATICAMLPLLFADSETESLVSKGLAVVVIGGLTVATALTLIIVPVFYELLYFRNSMKQRLGLESQTNEENAG